MQARHAEAGPRPEILDHMWALSDPLRTRLLLVLERNELTVSELCTVLQLPQSTVSRHLKVLSDAGWVASRPDGTRRLYQMPAGDPDGTPLRLWHLTKEELAATPTAVQDEGRLQSVLAHRRLRSQEFFAGEADRWDQLRDELFGPSFFLSGLLGLLDEQWVVADLGCGSGPVAAALAPFVRRVIAVDGSSPMLAAAGERLRRFSNVDIRRGELESLPIEDATLDAAVLTLVLHHLPDPGRVLGEVARVLRVGGRVVVVDMLPHERHDYRQQMGHVWMGFPEQRIRRLLSGAGFGTCRFRNLPPADVARGPALFSATAVRESALPEVAQDDVSFEQR